MGREDGHRFPSITRASSPRSVAALVCLVVALSYLAPKLEGAMILNPQTVWPFWPGCAILVSVLLLVPGRIWPILIPAAFATFALYDLEAGVPVKSIAWFLPANTVEVLTSALCLRYSFNGVPRLDSVKALAKYSFFAVILAPVGAAFFSANGIGGNYWKGWRVCFLSEALAFVTLTPAILSWISEGPAWLRKPRACYLEPAALITGLVLLSYVIFAEPGRHYSPALLYSLVPFLLWAALRFGSLGITSSAVLISFLTIWGAIHNRGPFAEQSSLNGILSLQFFLVFAAMPFMFLAALGEDHKAASKELALSNERFRLAMEAGTSVAWDLAVQGRRNVWVGDLQTIFGISLDTHVPSAEDLILYVHPEDRQRVSRALHDAKQNRVLYALEFRIARSDGTIRWLAARGRFYYSTDDEPERLLGVALDITERKQAEQVLREGEERFRVVANAAPVMIWMSGTDKLCTYVNQPWLEFTGRPLEAELGNGWVESVHPEDLNKCMHTYTRAFDRRESFQMEYRLRRHDGKYRWLTDMGVPRFNPDQSFAGYIGSATDVTERKLAEESLADVGRKLIEAHEEERTWIARELHDDVNQRMALLSIELDRWNQQLPPSAVEFHDHIHHASQRLSDIAADIQALSHRLHSSKLEYLGIVAAANSFCKELSQQQTVEIDFSHTDIPRSLPKEISLCLFRVLQETLRNAVKHSGVRHFKVELRGTEGEIQLTVSDLGVGFDPQDAIHHRGLGLISMRERMQLVSGEISIKSHPGDGTTIHARVPFRGTNPLLAVG
jgi:PAS domain S-box-containing protein